MKISSGLHVPILILAVLGGIQPQSYMVLSPRQFKDGSTLPIYVEMLSEHVPYESIEARLVRLQPENVKENRTAANITITSGVLKLGPGNRFGTIDLHVPTNLTWGNYHVTIKGSGIIAFENSSQIYYSRRYPRIGAGVFIQTDKAIYKPGQKVLYRVFMVDRDLKPRDPVFDLAILDPRRNKIVERTALQDPMGVSGDLQLSEYAQLGPWTISVNMKDGENVETVEYTFKVGDYVLPRWSVTVNLPEYGQVSNPELKGTVTAKYTYGKPVKGNVVLIIRRQYGRNFFDPHAIQTRFSIDGEAEFIIPTDALLKLDPQLLYDTLVVEANVTEPTTGTTSMGTEKITFHKETFTMNFMGYSSDYFKPGFKYTTYLKIVQSDGRPLPSSGKPVKLSVSYFIERNTTSPPLQHQSPYSSAAPLIQFISPFHGGPVLFMPDIYMPLPSDGMLEISLDIPDDAVTGRVLAEYSDRKEIKNIQRFRSDSDSYVHLDMVTSNVKVGKQAEFSVSSNKVPKGRVTYHIIFEDDIIETHYTSISAAFTPAVFYVTMTSAMTPTAKIIAYYIDDTGEIIADALIFNVMFAFENEVGMNFDKKQVEPGSTVSLNVRADPGSIVHILVVDKSVRLLRKGNDITMQRVLDSLGMRLPTTEWRAGGRYIPKRVGNVDDSLDVFTRAGLNLMTDAKIKDYDLYNAYRSPRRRMYSSQSMNAEMGHGIVHGQYPAPKLRKDFPETWIWTNQTIGSNGTISIDDVVPDTITDWVATAFALNMKTGLGVVPESANLTVFLPFYVNLQLPNSVIRGEVAVIQAVVFNYYPYDMYVFVVLKESKEEFIGIQMDHFNRNSKETNGNMEKCILVKANDVSSAYFTIKPISNGVMDIVVEAVSYRANDAVKRSIIVKPPGEMKEDNYPIIVSYPEEETGDVDEYTRSISYPQWTVPDSERLRVSVIGDIFGTSVENLDELIKIPHGCGEQNMVLFAPAVYAANYLLATDRYKGERKAMIENSLTTGYQRQLLYLRGDGSFSAFGTADREGSLWLTAFVLKSFAQASKLVYIDPDIMSRSVEYIIKHQRKDGSFNKTGIVHHKAMQGSTAANNRSMAAYVLIALVEVKDREIITNKTTIKRLTTAITSTTSYLKSQVHSMTDDYEVAITAYAFSRLSYGDALAAASTLDASPNKVTIKGNQKHWQDAVKSHMIEISSYALLAYTRLKDKERGLSVIRWLLEQRNPHGGFVSTQDTVIALQALGAYAELTYTPNINLTIEVKTSLHRTRETFTVNSENKDVLQFIDLPGRHDTVYISTHGTGFGLVEIGVFYHINEDDVATSFDLILTTSDDSEVNKFTLQACFNWLRSGNSGMVLLDMGFPSGFAPDLATVGRQTFTGVGKYPANDYFAVIKRKEMAGERLVIYFDEITDQMACVSVKVTRETIIGDVQPASVRVYSYYDTDKSIRRSYLPASLKQKGLCELCGQECGCVFNPDVVSQRSCAFASGTTASPMSEAQLSGWVPHSLSRWAHLAARSPWNSLRSWRWGDPVMPQFGPITHARRRTWRMSG